MTAWGTGRMMVPLDAGSRFGAERRGLPGTSTGRLGGYLVGDLIREVSPGEERAGFYSSEDPWFSAHSSLRKTPDASRI